MLDIGFSELLLIAVVALIVVGPKDLPVVIRHCAKFFREMREVYSGLKRQMNAVMDEVGASDLKREMTTIIDLEGKPQQAFDVKELEGLKAESRVQSPEFSEGGAMSVASPRGEAMRLSASALSRSGEGLNENSPTMDTPLTLTLSREGRGDTAPLAPSVPQAPVIKP